MFCSRCGKTIPQDTRICPGCGSPAGNARFSFSEITSAQSIIVPGENEYEPIPVQNYTRTTYTSMSDQQKESGEIDSRTSYRQIYNGSAPEDVRSEMRSATEESRIRVARRDEATRREIESVLSDTSDPFEEKPVEEPSIEEVTVSAPSEDTAPDDEGSEAPIPPISRENLSDATLEKIDELDASLRMEDEDLDMSQFKARPIEARSRAGISLAVSEYIREIEDNQSRKARRKAAEPVDDLIDDIEETEDLENIEDITEEAPVRSRRTIIPIRKKKAPAADEISENDTAVADDITDEDLLDDSIYDEDRPSAIGTVIKILVAVVVVAALAFGVVRYIGYIRSNQSSAPIEGVTESFYNDAIALLDTHNTDQYRNELLSAYASDGMSGISPKLASDTAAFKALMPAEPAANDATFLEAVLKIQDNIGSAILMDAISDAGSADSAARWSVVNNSIAQLKSAGSAAELTAIINGETITVRNETPAPTAEPIVYTSLQKGDENDAVLKLQVRLYTLGYLEGDRDGAFGSKTQTAVKLFQKTAGMTETGIADSDTQALLFSDDAPYAPGAVTPTPAPSATPEPTPEPVEAADEDLEQAA